MRIFLVICFVAAIFVTIYLLRDGKKRLDKAVAEDDWTWIVQMTIGFLGAIFFPIALIVSIILLFL